MSEKAQNVQDVFLNHLRKNKTPVTIFLVNGVKVDIPSYSVKEGDVITVIARSQKKVTIEHAMEEVKGRGIPEWLSFDSNTITGRVNAMPTREQINLPVQEQLIVELYSK